MRHPSVIDRASLILGAFDDEVRLLGLSELARRAGLPKATVYRLALDLVACRLLERDGTGFCLGLRLFELGQRVPHQRSLRHAAAPYMADLREATRQTVNLGVLEGRDVVYVEILRQRNAAPALSLARTGGRLPAHCTALGKALLAFSSPGTLSAFFAEPLERMSARTIVDPQHLNEMFEAVRDTGVAYDLEESAPGLMCAASPVFGPDRRLIAALSVSGRSHEMILEHVSLAVRTSALSVSRALGALPVPG
ncbi:MAG: IclR family transcriptional regulator [Acidimicrobiia bacterium]